MQIPCDCQCKSIYTDFTINAQKAQNREKRNAMFDNSFFADDTDYTDKSEISPEVDAGCEQFITELAIELPDYVKLGGKLVFDHA